jgi:hypothetical protein
LNRVIIAAIKTMLLVLLDSKVTVSITMFNLARAEPVLVKLKIVKYAWGVIGVDVEW